MKLRNLLCRIALFGVSVWLLCFLFAATAIAIETPWITLQPDSETTTESAQAERDEPAGEKSETSTTERSGSETDPAPESIQKRGCGSTVAGTAMLFPVLLSVLFIGSNVSQKRD